MYGGMVKLVARPGRREELLDFLRWDAEVARRMEPGTLRFDVWEAPGEPDAFCLYEAYVDAAAFGAHQAGEPFARFVDHIVPNVIDPPIWLLPFAESTVSNADD